jgi:hypothetical protein
MTEAELLRLKEAVDAAKAYAAIAQAEYASAVLALSDARADTLAKLLTATNRLKAARLDYAIARADYEAEGKGPTAE